MECNCSDQLIYLFSMFVKYACKNSTLSFLHPFCQVQFFKDLERFFNPIYLKIQIFDCTLTVKANWRYKIKLFLVLYKKVAFLLPLYKPHQEPFLG